MQDGVSCAGFALPPPKDSPVPWEQSCPEAPLAEAPLAINGRLIIQTLGDKGERDW